MGAGHHAPSWRRAVVPAASSGGGSDQRRSLLPRCCVPPLPVARLQTPCPSAPPCSCPSRLHLVPENRDAQQRRRVHDAAAALQHGDGRRGRLPRVRWALPVLPGRWQGGKQQQAVVCSDIGSCQHTGCTGSQPRRRRPPCRLGQGTVPRARHVSLCLCCEAWQAACGAASRCVRLGQWHADAPTCCLPLVGVGSPAAKALAHPHATLHL